MEDKFLDYFQKELTWLKEMSYEFSLKYPDVSKRLGISSQEEILDPYVERLLEGFAFLTSKIQMNIDEEYPKFTQQILEVFYPNITMNIPSTAVIHIHPDDTQGNIDTGYIIPRGTILNWNDNTKENINCKYQTTKSVVLYPLNIKSVHIEQIPKNINCFIKDKQFVYSLKIVLSCSHESIYMSQIKCNELSFYVSGEEYYSNKIFELIMNTELLFVNIPDRLKIIQLNKSNIKQEGFNENQSLIPNDLRHFTGYRLIREYFYFPNKFRFFKITNLLSVFLKSKSSKNLEFFFISRRDYSKLEKVIDENHIKLYCTPIVNLFNKNLERIDTSQYNFEYPLIADKLNNINYEIYSIISIYGVNHHNKLCQKFQPLFKHRNFEENLYWYTLRREYPIFKKSSNFLKKVIYTGSQVFLSLIDEKNPPWGENIKFVDIKALCSNRHLPYYLTQSNDTELFFKDFFPIQSISVLYGPTVPSFNIKNKNLWSLINLIKVDFSELVNNKDRKKSLLILKEILKIHSFQFKGISNSQISGIINFFSKKYYHLLSPPEMYIEGYKNYIFIDENFFSNSSAWILGSVLSHFFLQVFPINSIIQTILLNSENVVLGKWKYKK